MTYLSFRTKALVLELLAAVCLVSGGHEIILTAFDNFKEVSSFFTFLFLHLLISIDLVSRANVL